MNRLLFIWVIIFLWTLPLFAQSVDTAWVRRYNGPENKNDGANAIKIDNMGNVYVTGASFRADRSFDYVTLKYGSSGLELWETGYQARVYPFDGDEPIAIPQSAMAVDSAGKVYVTGSSYYGETEYDYVSIKYFQNGDTCWIRRYNGPANSGDWPYDIAVYNSGNVYVTGISDGKETADDFATIKYYPDGETAWARRFNSPGKSYDYAYAIAVNDSGDVFVAGNNGTVKYDRSGNLLWHAVLGGSDMTADDSGNVYVTGSRFSSDTKEDYTTVKYSPGGDTVWVSRYNGPGSDWDVAKAIAVDISGNVFVTGVSMGTGTHIDYCTIKYLPNGDTAWVRRYNGPGNGADFAVAIALDNLGNVYVTGTSPGNQTHLDYATIKYYPNGDIAWIIRYNGPGNSSDKATAISVDGSENVFVTGESEGIGTGSDYTTIKYVQKSEDETKGWKIYQYEKPGFEIKYPADILMVSKEGEKVVFTHSISFEHPNPCAFSDEAPATVKELTDFRVTLETISKSFKETIATYEGGSITQYYLLDDTLRIEPGFIDKMSIGELNGYRIAKGVEGCGFFAYYFPLDQNNTLKVERSYITELQPVMPDYKTYLKLPGIIPPDEEERLFNRIVSSFKFPK